MLFTFHEMDEEHARAILEWRYESPYAFYNASAEDLEKDLAVLLNPSNAFYYVCDERGELVANCCFGPEARVPGGDYSGEALDIGGGMRPDLTGLGMGSTLLEAILNFARSTFGTRVFRETIAAWNHRALKMSEKAGFHPVQRFVKEDGTSFIVLLREA
jgi:RimJ/RimL family protein N-acetyltransferase